jgi:hypothetical protein
VKREAPEVSQRVNVSFCVSEFISSLIFFPALLIKLQDIGLVGFDFVSLGI